MRVPGTIALLSLLGVVALACGRDASVEPAPTRSYPDVAQVRCGPDGSTKVETPTVQARPDGVHVDVLVPPDSELAFIVWESGGRNAEDGPFVFPVPPGRMHVACLDPYEDDAGDDSLYRSIEVVDMNAVYVDATMRCKYTGVGGEHPGPSLGSDPVEATRGFLHGLVPTDEIERVGYVARPSDARVAVRREGEVVAILTLEPVDGGWGWIGFTSCPEAGISY